MSNKFWTLMDQFFLLLISISGEEDNNNTSINHIL